MTIRLLLWSAFLLILTVTGAIALAACVLRLPGVGVVIERCAKPAVAEGVPYDETADLERRLLELKLHAALSPDCTEVKVVEKPKELENEPEIEAAEQIILILDTSTSMNNDGRFEIARQAILPVLENSTGTPPISLWSYNNTCNNPPRKMFPSAGRSAGEVASSLSATASFSPLTDSLNAIPDMLSPGSAQTLPRAVNVLLFADGNDNCNKDPCSASANLKNRFPHLYIHVVAIGQDLERLQCVARATGGASVQSEDVDAVRRVASSIVQQSK